MKPTTTLPCHVLVVDDQPEIQELLETLLADAGFAVTTASTAWEALEILQTGNFNVMITDVVLPGDVDGVELVAYARARSPELRSLFISGYGDPVTDDPDRDDFVKKPFRSWELLGCVYELLNRDVPPVLRRPARGAAHAIIEAKIACLRRQRLDRAFAERAAIQREDGSAALAPDVRA